MTEDIFAGQSYAKPDELAKLIELLPASGWFLEIGSAHGVTASMIARAHPGSRIVSIDPYIDPHPERLANWKANQVANQHLWVGEIDTFHLFCGQKFDVVFVDGDHRYAGVMRDLLYATMLVKEDGTIAVHDCGDPEWYQVQQAFDRFISAQHKWKIDAVVGSLAILRMGK
jgi:predicted O-methyltransferase YrrM